MLLLPMHVSHSLQHQEDVRDFCTCSTSWSWKPLSITVQTVICVLIGYELRYTPAWVRTYPSVLKCGLKREITVFILLSVNYLMSFLLYTSISTTIINQQRTIMLVYIFNTCFFLFWCLFSSLDVFNRQVFIYSNLILAGAKFVYI